MNKYLMDNSTKITTNKEKLTSNLFSISAASFPDIFTVFFFEPAGFGNFVFIFTGNTNEMRVANGKNISGKFPGNVRWEVKLGNLFEFSAKAYKQGT